MLVSSVTIAATPAPVASSVPRIVDRGTAWATILMSAALVAMGRAVFAPYHLLHG